jgi:UDP-N-acetyl-D-mannosaminuronate dehydrogenase
MWARPANLAKQLVQDLAPSVPVNELRVLVVGAAFKPGEKIVSCSPTVLFMKALQNELGVKTVNFADPLVPQASVQDIPKFNDQMWEADVLDREFDVVCVGLRQKGIDFRVLEQCKKTKVIYYCA